MSAEAFRFQARYCCPEQFAMACLLLAYVACAIIIGDAPAHTGYPLCGIGPCLFDYCAESCVAPTLCQVRQMVALREKI